MVDVTIRRAGAAQRADGAAVYYGRRVYTKNQQRRPAAARGESTCHVQWASCAVGCERHGFLGLGARASQSGRDFQFNKTIEVTGVIQSVSWRNPHGQILLSVKDEAGKETVWDAETASISILRNRGADGSSIRVGDRVTIAGSPSVRNRPEILARSVLLPSGYEFTFGSPNAYFPAGKAGRIIGRAKIEGDVAAATAEPTASSACGPRT